MASAVPNSNVALPEAGELTLIRPFVLRLDSNGYSYLDHDGRPLITLSAQELTIAKQMGRPRTVDNAFRRVQEKYADLKIELPAFTSLLQRLLAAGLLHIAKDVTVIDDAAKLESREVQRVSDERKKIVQQSLQAAEEKEQLRRERTGHIRTKVIPVQTELQPLLSMGLMMSYGMAYDEGSLN